MPQEPFIVPLSRRFAASLGVVDGPMTSLDLALWLAFVCHALTVVDEVDEDGITTRMACLLDPTDGFPVWAHGRTLLAATGLRSHALLERPFARLSETTVSLGGRKGRTHRLWHGWEGSPIDRTTPTEIGHVSAAALAWGMIDGQLWPVAVDLTALARFRSRFSAIIYLRALAWMHGAGTPTAWERTAPGTDVSLRIPMSDLARALGTGQLDGMGPWNAKGFGTAGRGGPVHEDLESAGIRLRTTWVMAGAGARKVPVALKVRVSRTARAVQPVRKRRQASSPSRPSSYTTGAPTP